MGSVHPCPTRRWLLAIIANTLTPKALVVVITTSHHEVK
jgi:hypothetical protein